MMKRRTKERFLLALALAGAALIALNASDAAAQRHHTTRDSGKISAPEGETIAARQSARSWLAGDHHIHSQYSVDWDETTDPPSPIVAGAAIYPIPTNAEMAKQHGLSWMVSTDHGGPNHSKVNLELAYPELLESREAVPGLIQFYGMEFDTPAAEHSSLIIPHSHEEHETLYDLESRFARREPFPPDSTRDTEAAMLDALAYMRELRLLPLLFANHPSRSATGLGVYGSNTPRELRNWNDTAPRVAVGMEGAPGHQANAITPDGAIDPEGIRGGYRNHPTMGGFDQMTARLGGFWDSMLGEGRRWWITSTSDSHVHWREGGSDFWPGEYSKTYVFAEHSYDSILDGLRNGRVFVTTGDLISELDVTVAAGGREASIGGQLNVEAGENVVVTIRLRDSESANHRGETPAVRRVDLIFGEITGIVEDLTTDTNPTTRVVARFTSEDWEREGEYREMTYTFENVRLPGYVRVRGTNTDEPEPQIDPSGEDPWSDLWFYSNPVFIDSR